MVAANIQTLALTDKVVAELAAAAYHVALRHGTRSAFIDLELDLWRALRATLADATDQPEVVSCPR